MGGSIFEAPAHLLGGIVRAAVATFSAPPPGVFWAPGVELRQPVDRRLWADVHKTCFSADERAQMRAEVEAFNRDPTIVTFALQPRVTPEQAAFAAAYMTRLQEQAAHERTQAAAEPRRRMEGLMTTQTPAPRALTRAEAEAAGYRCFDVKPSEVNARDHLIVGFSATSGLYTVATSPVRRAELLGMTETGRDALEAERAKHPATFSGPTAEEQRRDELLGMTSLGQDVLSARKGR